MNTPSPISLEPIEEARIEANALVGAFDDHRAVMDPTSVADRIRERQLHQAATFAVRIVEALERFEAHANQAIDLTGGQR